MGEEHSRFVSVGAEKIIYIHTQRRPTFWPDSERELILVSCGWKGNYLSSLQTGDQTRCTPMQGSANTLTSL